MIQAPLVLQAEEIPSSAKRVDALDDALTELFFIDNPIFKRGMPGVEDKIKEYVNSKNEEGIWIYFPWRDLAIRTLSEDLYFLLRTSRNRNIITHEEQLKYRAGKIGVAGLSVGSWVVSALVSSGGPQTLKIADFDVVEITNLNRIQAKLTDVKNPKIEVAAREVWELDPFAKLHLWDKGVSADTLRDFIIGEPRLDVFVDAMDSLDLKILSRFICQENRVPLVMGTDNGERVILDVERFDLEPNRPIFHGVVDISIDEVKKIDFKRWVELATKIVGPENLDGRMKLSLAEIGKTLPAVPQLGPTAAMAGSAVAYAIRRIITGQDMPSRRYFLEIKSQ